MLKRTAIILTGAALATAAFLANAAAVFADTLMYHHS